jgi:replication factor A1
MNISELNPRQGNVNIEGEITELGETKTYNKYGRELRVADAILKDDSGSIKLTLWNDDATRFKAGNKVRIVNGYVGEFQGEKQLTAGKFGKIEKISDNVTENEPENKPENEPEEEPAKEEDSYF